MSVPIDPFRFLLGPAQRAIYDFMTLREGAKVPSSDILFACPVNNLSCAIKKINKRFALVGDPRRIVCQVAPLPSGRGKAAFWQLTDVESE